MRGVTISGLKTYFQKTQDRILLYVIRYKEGWNTSILQT